MSRGEAERADTDLEFSYWFSVVVLMCLFVGFVFTSLCQVWDPFLELTIFVLTFLYLGVNWLSLLHCIWLSTYFQTQVVPFTSTWCRRENISNSGGSAPVQKIWDIQFFFLVIFNYCSHLLMTGWATSSTWTWISLSVFLSPFPEISLSFSL